MIKKYNVDISSGFNRSIMIPFFESRYYGFDIEGLDNAKRDILFNPKQLSISGKNKDIDISKATHVELVYLDDKYDLKALVLYCPTDKKYYFFRSEGPLKLKIQDNYISSSLDDVISDYETRRQKRKELDNKPGDFEVIKDIDFFENYYGSSIDKQVDNNSDITRLIFIKNNEFTADFIRLIERNEIVISNKESLPSTILTLDTMSRPELRSNRKDCLLVNFESGDIEYFIFTSRTKNSLVNHYYLFKKTGDTTFDYVLENICFNKVFSYKDISHLKFKDVGNNISEALSKTRYEDFYLKYLEFEKDEEVDDIFANDYEGKIVETLQQEVPIEKPLLSDELLSILQRYDYELNGELIYFNGFEDFPLASLGNGFIKIKLNRLVNDVTLTNQISSKDINKIDRILKDLLEKKPSTRLVSFEKLVNRIIKVKLNPKNQDQLNLIKEVEDIYKGFGDKDKLYPENYLNNVYHRFEAWVEEGMPKPEFLKLAETLPDDLDVYITDHARMRIQERVGSLSDEDQLKLAKVAYEKGEHSMHYYETDKNKFMCLNYIQNKHQGKTLRLYDGIVYIFSLTPPHGLVTVYPFEQSYNMYMKNRRI